MCQLVFRHLLPTWGAWAPIGHGLPGLIVGAIVVRGLVALRRIRLIVVVLWPELLILCELFWAELFIISELWTKILILHLP